jgi:hypothetical protein
VDTPSARILRRVRRALRDLDSDGNISDVEKLDLLYQISFEITQRTAALEPANDAPCPVDSQFLPFRY